MVPSKAATPTSLTSILSAPTLAQDFLLAFNPSLQSALPHSNLYQVDFTINEQPAVHAVCSASNDDDYVIRMWAPIESALEVNLLLFRKYVAYLEKYTMLARIEVRLARRE